MCLVNNWLPDLAAMLHRGQLDHRLIHHVLHTAFDHFPVVVVLGHSCGALLPSTMHKVVHPEPVGNIPFL